MKTPIISLQFALFFLLMNCHDVSAKDDGRSPTPTPSKIIGQPERTVIDINSFTSWVRHDGLFEAPIQNLWNGTFPKGTAGCIYADGIVWGGVVRDGQSPALRVNGSIYSTGLVPGAILTAGVREDPASPDVRIYRVRTDYATADLSDDAANFFLKPIDQVTPADIQLLRGQYRNDWFEWPAHKGAPFEDIDHNGVYNPNVDIPGIPLASQTIWFVANDLDAAQSLALYGSPPIGLEMQLTVWAYTGPGALSNVIFRRTRLIYKGTSDTPANALIDSMFIAQWSDPNLGDFDDDFAGCDSVLGLGYVYNADGNDDQYARFGLRPPAIGYDFLQGPIVPELDGTAVFDFKLRPGFKNLPMTTFSSIASGGTRSDPDLGGVYSGTLQWFNLMRGCEPRPSYPSCVPFTNHLGQVTNFELSGDPVSRRGDLDGRLPPGDRQIVMASGPFTMARGDTQEVVVAIIGGLGFNNLDSINKMKTNGRSSQILYDNLFQLSLLPPELSLTTEFFSPQSTLARIVADARALNVNAMTATLKKYDDISVATVSLFDDGVHNDGSAGDQIYGNMVSVTPQSEGLFLNLEVAHSNGSNVTWEHLADNVTTAGPVEVSAFAVFSDNLNDDGFVNPGENIRYGLTLRNGSTFNLANVAIIAEPDPESKVIDLGTLNAHSSVSFPYDAGDPNSYFSFDVPANYQDSNFDVVLYIFNGDHNLWQHAIRFAVVPFPRPVYGTPLLHIAGVSDWNFNVLVVNPNAAQNSVYEITISDSIDVARNRGFTLRNVTTNTILLTEHVLPDEFGHNIPLTEGFKVLRGENFGRLGLRQDLTQWISSNPSWFRGFRFTNDSHAAFNGGVTTGVQLDQYLVHVISSFDPTASVQVEVRFDPIQPQKAYRLRRTGPAAEYLIQDVDPFVDVPFSAWEVSNPNTPRQLTVAWRDNDDSGTWNPPVGTFDNFEIIFIYFKNYDPTGTIQFRMPPAAIPDEPTIGSKADIMYALSLVVRSGHTLNESTGTLFLHPYIGLSSIDQFTFNPIIVSVQDKTITPLQFSLAQNFPNPFNPATTIRFSIPQREKVRLKVYNLMGQEVAVLVDKELEGGFHQVEWRGHNKFNRDTTTGIYFYRLEAGEFVEVRKMVLLR